VAVVTNLAPNHLDVHKDMEEYVQAKKNILLHQNAFSRAVLNADNSITDSLSSDVRGNLMKFSRRNKQDSGAYALDGKIYVNGEYLMDAADIYIPGLHNLENYLAAICAVWGYVSKENIKKIAATFTGVEHRMELVRELNGVKYYNDSIATSPSRAMMGTLSVYNRKIIMIAGGADKNVPFDTVGNEICKKVKLLILIEPLKQEPGRKPCASMKLKAAVTGAPEYSDSNPEIIVVHTMEDAVLTAKERAKSGDIVSLCPVCTAFDMYANFEVRGKYYKETVNRLL
jgi:UDP-N-acetylmuramoylalanine--D-glutamate ligase